MIEVIVKLCDMMQNAEYPPLVQALRLTSQLAWTPVSGYT